MLPGSGLWGVRVGRLVALVVSEGFFRLAPAGGVPGPQRNDEVLGVLLALLLPLGVGQALVPGRAELLQRHRRVVLEVVDSVVLVVVRVEASAARGVPELLDRGLGPG